MEVCRTCDVGLAIFVGADANPNLANLAGASNKVFDYLASGLPVILPASSEWDSAFVKAGYAIATRSNSAKDLSDAIRSLYDNAGNVRAMGEAGRQKIRTEWNYEQQFKPVWQLLHSGLSGSSQRKV
jgi:glycosyltransferase involved in cell wall biosynthesis